MLMPEKTSHSPKSTQVTPRLVDLPPHITMGPRNLTEPLLLDGISLIATTVLLHTVLRQLRLSSPRSLLEPPLTVTDMVHVIPQRLANLRAVDVLPHGP